MPYDGHKNIILEMKTPTSSGNMTLYLPTYTYSIATEACMLHTRMYIHTYIHYI